MKLSSQAFIRLALLALLLCGCGRAASAQATEQLMTVQVPFAFQVGAQTLPAGQYTIKRDPQQPQFLRVESPDRKVSARTFITAQPMLQQPRRASLTFRTYGEQHFLAEVKDTRHGWAYALIRSKDERQLARATRMRALPDHGPTNN